MGQVVPWRPEQTDAELSSVRGSNDSHAELTGNMFHDLHYD